MPTPTDAAARVEHAGVEHTGEMLRFAGALTRDHVAALWKTLPVRGGVLPDGITRFDLQQVTDVDSAGLALLAELAARCGGAVAVDGGPGDVAALRSAYRLDPGLGFGQA
jgi:phospholipid transport system transporter-binding protein